MTMNNLDNNIDIDNMNNSGSFRLLILVASLVGYFWALSIREGFAKSPGACFSLVGLRLVRFN